MQSLFSLLQNYALPFVLVISVVVFVHEFGHYWIARRCGIKIESFSLGFGRKIFGWVDKHGTQWQVAWLPLGGYVKMFGDADPASTPDESVKTMTEEEKKVAFFHQSVGKRMAVVAAGPVTNYLFAMVVLAILFVFQGQPYSPAAAGEVLENSVAAQAGIQAGDTILSIGGRGVERFEDVKRHIGMNAGTPVDVVIDRAGQQITYTLTPEVTVQTDRFGGEHRMGRIGIVSHKAEHRKLSPLMAVQQAGAELVNISMDTLQAVGQMIMGTRGSEEIGGPLRIAEMSGNVAQDGGWALFWFMGVISINLGLINLFPIPLLDGGHLVFYTLEALFRRPVNERVQEIGMRIGLTLVVTLMVFATWNDLVHLKVVAKIVDLFS